MSAIKASELGHLDLQASSEGLWWGHGKDSADWRGSRTVGFVPTSAIRYYESLDILPKPERTTLGYRGYSSDDLDLLRFVARLRGLEFPLSDVRNIVALRRDGKAPCDAVRSTHLGRLRQLRPGSRTCEDFRTNSGRWKRNGQRPPRQLADRLYLRCP